MIVYRLYKNAVLKEVEKITSIVAGALDYNTEDGKTLYEKIWLSPDDYDKVSEYWAESVNAIVTLMARYVDSGAVGTDNVEDDTADIILIEPRRFKKALKPVVERDLFNICAYNIAAEWFKTTMPDIAEQYVTKADEAAKDAYKNLTFVDEPVQDRNKYRFGIRQDGFLWITLDKGEITSDIESICHITGRYLNDGTLPEKAAEVQIPFEGVNAYVLERWMQTAVLNIEQKCAAYIVPTTMPDENNDLGEGDQILRLAMPPTWVYSQTKQVAITMNNYVVDYCCAMWFDRVTDKQAETFAEKANVELQQIKELLELRDRPFRRIARRYY